MAKMVKVVTFFYKATGGSRFQNVREGVSNVNIV